MRNKKEKIKKRKITQFKQKRINDNNKIDASILF